ncbi:MAG: cyanophycinase [Bacteroidetes bacterium]|nr:cyanophycinase [Bacteroidota bacterium]
MRKPKGTLIIIGGKEYKGDDGELDMERLNKNFVEYEILANVIPLKEKKKNKTIEVITTASEVPTAVAQDYKEAFAALGHKDVDFINIENRVQAQEEEYLERIKKAHSVFFTGGDQFRLSTILGGTPLIEAIMERYYEDSEFVVAGTSAGAMVMSKIMLYEGHNMEAMLKGDVKTTLGFGFLDNCIIDTHFVKRGRLGRLVEAIVSNPPSVGIGLGEDTALMITKGEVMECSGSGMVVIVEGDNIKHTNVAYTEPNTPLCVENMTIHILASGNGYVLNERKFIPAEKDMEMESTSNNKT